jgi:hypothetical protein
MWSLTLWLLMSVAKSPAPFVAVNEGVAALLRLPLPEQPRQPRDVDGDAPRLVGRQHLSLHRLRFGRPAVQIACPLACRTT